MYDLSRITSSDTLATIGGGYMPQYVTLTAGEASFNMILRTGGSQTITCIDYDDQTKTASTVTIPVLATDVSYFSVSGLSGTYVAGVTTTATIVARDQFGNINNRLGGYYLLVFTQYRLFSAVRIYNVCSKFQCGCFWSQMGCDVHSGKYGAKGS